jgi:hypothetical protein
VRFIENDICIKLFFHREPFTETPFAPAPELLFDERQPVSYSAKICLNGFINSNYEIFF